MIKKFLDKTFKLPPVEERVDIRFSQLRWLTNMENPSSEKDDIYLYYLAGRAAWRLGGLIGSAVILAYYNEGLQIFLGWNFALDYKHTKMVTFLGQYSHIFEGIILIAFLPFYLIKFRWNIDPKKYDVLGFDKRFGIGRKYPKKRWFVLPFMLLLALIALFGITFGNLIPFGLFLDWYNRDTVFSLLFYISIILLINSFLFVILLKAIVVLWRFIGPYEEVPFTQGENVQK